MKKNKKGFTLVELVIVVAVMAVLIAVAIPTVTSITKTAKETVADTNARTIESTLKLAEANKNKDGNGDNFDELDADEIEAALDAAKLGIDGGAFVYDSLKGTVVADKEYDAEAGTSSIFDVDEDNEATFLIVYTDGEAEVTPGGVELADPTETTGE